MAHLFTFILDNVKIALSYNINNTNELEIKKCVLIVYICIYICSKIGTE